MRIYQLPSAQPGVRAHGHVQRGSGIGSIFSKLLSYARPLVKTALKASRPYAKKALKSLAKTGISVVGDTVADVAGGDVSVKEAVKKNLKRGVSKIGQSAQQGAKRMMVDAGFQPANVIKGKRSAKKRKTSRKQSGKGRSRPKAKGRFKKQKGKGKNVRRKAKPKKKQSRRRRSRGIFAS